MGDTIRNRAHATAWQREFDAAAPRVGDLAPDFELPLAGGGGTLRLSQFQGQKPVALIFGSFT
jgi:hypothetical protein